MATAAQVLDLQHDLISRLANSDFRRYLAGCVVPFAEHVAYGTEHRADDALIHHPDLMPKAYEVVDALRSVMPNALPYMVTHDMSLLVQHTAAQLDGTDAFYSALAPSQSGFVWFERPLPMQEVRGRTMLIHCMIWQPAWTDATAAAGGASSRGIAYWTFNDGDDPDEVTDDLRGDAGRAEGATATTLDWANRNIGRWMFDGVQGVVDGTRMGDMILEPGGSQLDYIKGEGLVAQPGTNTIRYLHALWLLMGQSIVSNREELADRAGQRRAGRRGLPPMITVIHLRRVRTAEGEGESLVEWSHRWVARQHPRWQPYGKRPTDHVCTFVENGSDARPEMTDLGMRMTQHCQTNPRCERTRQRIIIPEAVKGPAGKPLWISKKVIKLDR